MKVAQGLELVACGSWALLDHFFDTNVLIVSRKCKLQAMVEIAF